MAPDYRTAYSIWARYTDTPEQEFVVSKHTVSITPKRVAVYPWTPNPYGYKGLQHGASRFDNVPDFLSNGYAWTVEEAWTGYIARVERDLARLQEEVTETAARLEQARAASVRKPLAEELP